MKEKVKLIRSRRCGDGEDGIFEYLADVAYPDGRKMTLAMNYHDPNGLPFRDGAELELTCIKRHREMVITKISCSIEAGLD